MPCGRGVATSPTRAIRRGDCGTTMFVYKDGGCTARYTIRFRREGA